MLEYIVSVFYLHYFVRVYVCNLLDIDEKQYVQHLYTFLLIGGGKLIFSGSNTYSANIYTITNFRHISIMFTSPPSVLNEIPQKGNDI